MILKNAYKSSRKFEIIVHHSTSKVHYYMFGVYLLNFIIMHIFLLKWSILIHQCFCHIDDYTICLWHNLNKIHSI